MVFGGEGSRAAPADMSSWSQQGHANPQLGWEHPGLEPPGTPWAWAGSLRGASKPQTCSVFPACAWVSEQQTQCGFGLICRGIFTPPSALFLASPSACQHSTFAGAAAHLPAVVGFFKHFPPSSSLLPTCSPLCSSSAHPHRHLCFFVHLLLAQHGCS